MNNTDRVGANIEGAAVAAQACQVRLGRSRRRDGRQRRQLNYGAKGDCAARLSAGHRVDRRHGVFALGLRLAILQQQESTLRHHACTVLGLPHRRHAVDFV